LTLNYNIPPDACNTYSVTLKLLREFEEDLHIHVHLENNILFPKSLALAES
jgi:regulator of cell morphogenesis and NO signaling